MSRSRPRTTRRGAGFLGAPGAAAVGALALCGALLAPSAQAAPPPGPANPPKEPVATGYGGAVSTVDLDATRAGLKVLRQGGNAVDAAVAAAATLGVTEPFSAGIGGGGFFVYYDAESGQVQTLDGRESAPSAADETLFLDEDGSPLSFDEARVSGRSVGAPGTAATWQEALDRWGSRSLASTLKPATKVAKKGFEVDQTFVDQVEQNADMFDDFTASSELFLPDGAPPKVGSTFRNPDLADTYRLLAKGGMDAFYGGELGDEIAATVQAPPTTPDADRTVRPGELSAEDIGAYEVREQEPTRTDYRGMEVYGMAPVSSGGTTVGEALNILESTDPGGTRTDTPSAAETTAVEHRYLEAAALSYADRNRYVGDPEQVDVPTGELTSEGFAAERACEFDPTKALPKPVRPGVPDGDYSDCGEQAGPESGPQNDGTSTTHLTTADRWGNVVSYTLTIESTGGSGITVPGRGFLLNNELTDFNFEPTQGEAADPNLPGPSKRPRSSMSPTIVLEDGEPLLAVGSPGGATIITTVLQTLVNRFELGMELPDALAAPRATPQNQEEIEAEAGFLSAPETAELEALGHRFTEDGEIGAATGVEFLSDHRLRAVAEPERRGGGSAGVVIPLQHRR